jgi:hypothetical protein
MAPLDGRASVVVELPPEALQGVKFGFLPSDRQTEEQPLRTGLDLFASPMAAIQSRN